MNKIYIKMSLLISSSILLGGTIVFFGVMHDDTYEIFMYLALVVLFCSAAISLKVGLDLFKVAYPGAIDKLAKNEKSTENKDH